MTTTTKSGRDTHLVLDLKLWSQVEKMAKDEDRSVTATIRVLIKEALSARNGRKES
jgi:hypothetical protein